MNRQLDKINKPELIKLAKSMHLTGYSRLDKDSLIRLIETGVRERYVPYTHRILDKEASFDDFDITKNYIVMFQHPCHGLLICGVNLNGRFNSSYLEYQYGWATERESMWSILNKSDMKAFFDWYKHIQPRHQVDTLFRLTADVINSKKITNKELAKWIPVSIIRSVRSYKQCLK